MVCLTPVSLVVRDAGTMAHRLSPGAHAARTEDLDGDGKFILIDTDRKLPAAGQTANVARPRKATRHAWTATPGSPRGGAALGRDTHPLCFRSSPIGTHLHPEVAPRRIWYAGCVKRRSQDVDALEVADVSLPSSAHSKNVSR